MNKLVNFEILEELDAKMTLDEIRQISNIIQALKNVLMQCDGNPTFSALRQTTQEFLELSQKQLFDAIHQS